jgi:hypothetical protein
MGASTDSFLLYERGQEDPSQRLTSSLTSEHGPIYPGGVLDMETMGEDRRAESPYSAVSCAVEAVVFSDGTFYGEPAVVDAIFEGRETIADDARSALENSSNRWMRTQGEMLCAISRMRS